MPRYLGALALILLITMVLLRILALKKRGVSAMKFGQTNKSDFLIPPFALFYVYSILAGAFDWPSVRGDLFNSTWTPWLGVAVCALAVALMVGGIVSFGASFRVGIDARQPGKLVTSGIFAATRNPIYVAFAFALVGEFLIQPNWLLAAYVFAGFALLHRQVLREESSLSERYGTEYRAYSARVRRYL